MRTSFEDPEVEEPAPPPTVERPPRTPSAVNGSGPIEPSEGDPPDRSEAAPAPPPRPEAAASSRAWQLALGVVAGIVGSVALALGLIPPVSLVVVLTGVVALALCAVGLVGMRRGRPGARWVGVLGLLTALVSLGLASWPETAVDQGPAVSQAVVPGAHRTSSVPAPTVPAPTVPAPTVPVTYGLEGSGPATVDYVGTGGRHVVETVTVPWSVTVPLPAGMTGAALNATAPADHGLLRCKIDIPNMMPASMRMQAKATTVRCVPGD